MFEHWLQPQALSDPAASTNSQAQIGAATLAPAPPPWTLLVRDLTLDGGLFSFSDKLPVRPVAFDVSAVALQVKNLSTAGKEPMQVQGALQWQAGGTPAGRLKWQGQARLDPLSVQTTLEAVRLPLHVLEPYGADLLNIEVLRAYASFKGQFAFAPTPAGTSLQLNGDVALEDVKANYSANLTELTGKLGAFSSQPQAGEPAMAELALRGRAQGTATLDIQGQINPLAKPLVLDLKARVRDLELPPLSAYAVRHAGHGIERGKLSVDLSYKVQADGQLLASNNIVLNQLKFGDKVDGAPTSLPVRLAVALLADRQGVIDIDLPVSGSLNDPEFKLGPIVYKLIVNLVVKAVTAPFSLIASAFGSAEEPGVVNFAPGSAALDVDGRAGLDKVVKALQERPALHMTVVGMASLELEREAFKREQLQALLLGEQRREAVLAGRAVAQTGAGASVPATLSPEESLALLGAVYRRSAIPKQLTSQGQLQPLPKDEMENLLLSHLQAS